ncbi:MAG: glucokinase [Acidobacteria bacterium]|nr:glucokinase [Acidobacteriota bacterium]
MILAGDIGGTKCTLTLFSCSHSRLRSIYRFHIQTREVFSLEQLLNRFIDSAAQAGFPLSNGQVSSAAFGSAGTVVEDRVVSNNLPWAVERLAIANILGLEIEKIFLLNDLVAAAASLVHLTKDDLLQLNEGQPQPRAPMALIAAGTGLGEAILFWDGQRYQISPSEACLTDFAPRNDREFLLLQSLRHRMERVCTEDIISGRGFRAIHQIIFPGVQHAFFDEPGIDPAVKITQQALEGSCSACVETLQIWTEAYGAEAGNMALRVLPFGGVYVAGGIALKILSKLQDGSFVRAFSDKMKLSTQLAKIPIFVVLNEDAPVLGAAYEAMAALNGRLPSTS